MTTQEVANKLVEYCRKGDFETCYQELYSPEIESIEPKGAPIEHCKGFEELQAKGKQWEGMIETMHGAEIGDPIVIENHFALPWTMHVTFKGSPVQTAMKELCVYEVKDGKVVKEQFFYNQDNG